MHGIDDDEMSPLKMKTILLLDLRLNPQDVVQNYSTNDLSSVVLRSQVKEAGPLTHRVNSVASHSKPACAILAVSKRAATATRRAIKRDTTFGKAGGLLCALMKPMYASP